MEILGVQLYRAVWRWHFYASLLVIPFLLALTLSGLLMLISKPIDAWTQQSVSKVIPQEQALQPSELMARVLEVYPDKHVQLYIPAKEKIESVRFNLINEADVNTASFSTPSITVMQNPYTGDILSTTDPRKSFYNAIKKFHGTLYIGDVGDRLLEIASGLAILMVLSGLYLAWPRPTTRKPQTVFATPLRRESWRYLHKVIGLVIAIPMLFFLLSGLAWTGVWGSQLVQPWSAIPKPDTGAARADHHHGSLNREGVHQVPWVLEKTPMPKVEEGSNHLNLDDIVRIATDQGFEYFRVNLPGGNTKGWIVTATTGAGDITNPLKDRTIYIDPSDGHIIEDLTFENYPLVGKAMAAGIPLHEAKLGLWNLLLNFFLVSLMVFMIVSGIILWWKRRPAKKAGLLPPPANPRLSKIVIAVAVLISLCFPLSAGVLLLIILMDWLLVSRLSRLRVLLK